MTYVFFTVWGYPFTLATHIKDEGNPVICCMLREESQLELDSTPEKEDHDFQLERLSNYDGILEKTSLTATLAKLAAVPTDKQNDYFIFFDHSDMYKISEKVLSMGFRNGIFPTEFYYRLEKERKFARDFAEKNYPDIKLAESQDFDNIQEAVKLLEESSDIFALKSNGNAGPTVVPSSDDPEQANGQIIDALEKNKKDYEAGGFLLEKKIKDALEVTPVMVFYNGEPIYAVAEFENKPFGCGNIGAQKGGNQALSLHTGPDSLLNKIAFPPIVFELAKQQPGLSIYDAGLLYDGEDFYFTEFCSMRYGWDGIMSEIVMADNGKPFVTRYFEQIMAGKNPLVNECGASVRLFNYEGDAEGTSEPKGDELIEWDESIENYLFLYAAKKKGDRVVNTGNRDFVAAITGAADSPREAVGLAYERIKKFHFDKIYYRYEADFLSTSYRSSIPNRMKALGRFL